MGTTLALTTMFRTAFGFHRKWIDYRTTSENLRLERDCYTCILPPYTGRNRDQLFFNKAIKIICRENKTWRIKELEQLKNPSKTNNLNN